MWVTSAWAPTVALLTNYDPFVDAVSALLTANAAMPTAAIMALRTVTKIAKLKDTLNQPMRRPDLISNLPFLATTGVPVNQTQGSSQRCVRNNRGRLHSTDDRPSSRSANPWFCRERYWADNGQIGFVADLRS